MSVYLAPVIYQCLKMLNKVKIPSIFAALCHPCPQKPLHYKAVPNGLQVQVLFGGRCAKTCHWNSLPLLRGMFEDGWLAQPRTLLSNVILLGILTHASWVVEIKNDQA